MGEISLLKVVLSTLTFFLIGALWYGPLFGKQWRELVGISEEDIKTGPKPGQNPIWLIMGLAFAFEMLVSLMLAHTYARTYPSDMAKLMIAFGFGAAIMAPALGINYLYQMRPGRLFAIDAGYFVVGCSAMGIIYALMD